MRIDILFESSRFNLSEVKPHFINPICFGEDLAAWLREKLLERGVPTIEPGQEDWGWYIESKLGNASYFLGIGGNADGVSTNPHRGEWRIMLEKRRTLMDRIRGRNALDTDDAMLRMLSEIVRGETEFTNVRLDTAV